MNSRILLFIFVLKTCVFALQVPINQADYVIVVNSKLRDSFWEGQFIALKENQGLEVGILEVSDAVFGNPATYTSQKDIRDALKNVWFIGGKKLKYILLVGDANIIASRLMANYESVSASKNFASSKYLNFIPGPSNLGAMSDHYNKTDLLSPFYPTTGFDYFVPEDTLNENQLIVSDDFYGNFEGDSILNFNFNPDNPVIIPEALVGRIPARNIGEIRAYVAKLIDYYNNLSQTTSPLSIFQTNILGLVDDRLTKHAPSELVRNPFTTNIFRKQMPGITLNMALNSQIPDLFNKNGTQNLLTLYTSTTGTITELDPFLMYRTKYELGPLYFRTHDRTAPGQDDDIDDFPNISDGSFTILLSSICDRYDFDGIDREDRAKILSLINGTQTYYDGYYTNNNDLMEDVLLNRCKGAIAAIGTRSNSQLNENTAFYERFLNAAYGGEYVLGCIYSSAKLYTHQTFAQNRSRKTPSNMLLGDNMLFGDPAMIVNTPNCNAPLNSPNNLQLTSNAGNLIAQWSTVIGASGYAVSISDIPSIMVWTTFTSAQQISIKCLPMLHIKHNKKYYINVKAYSIQNSVRTFNRNHGASGEIIIDKHVSPPTNPDAIYISDNSIKVTFTPSTDTDIAKYKIYRSLHSSQSSPVLLSNNAVSPFIDNACNSYDDYCYYISAVDICNNESEKAMTTPIRIIDYVQTILGFENMDLWRFTNGTTGILTNEYKFLTEGIASLSVTGNGYQRLNSPNMSTVLLYDKSKMNVDVFVGTTQPNPYWIGQLQLYINCPSSGIYEMFIGSINFSSSNIGKFNTISFNLPTSVRNVLRGDYDDFSISFALNTNYGSGPYLLDNVVFSD